MLAHTRPDRIWVFRGCLTMHDTNHNDMQLLVTEIAKALVDDPDSVEVQAVARNENTVLRLRVASADVGKVIGKQGRTARSMRTILSAVSMKLHHRYTLDILEEDEAGKPAASYLRPGFLPPYLSSPGAPKVTA